MRQTPHSPGVIFAWQFARRRRRAARLGLVAASAAVALVAAEVTAGYLYPFFQPWTVPPGLRDRAACDVLVAFDEHTGWWTRPHLNCIEPAERSVPVRTNSAGLRADREFGAKPAGVVRIGFFGDSFTFGALVTAEETYAAILERSVPGIEAVSFGLAGGGPDQGLLALRHKGAGLALDALVVAYTPENVERILMMERDGRPKPYFTFASGELRLHNHPVPFRPPSGPRGRGGRRPIGGSPLRDLALYQVVLAAARPVALTAGLYRPYAALYAGPPGALLERILAEFGREARGAPVVFAPLPTYHYIEYGLPLDYESAYRNAARAAGGAYVDLLPAFRRLTPDERRATRFRFDQHYTPLAHRVVAAALAPHIAALRDTIRSR